MEYFDTLGESSDENLKNYITKAKGQNNDILKMFLADPEEELSAWIIERRMDFILITSIRRSLTTLHKKGIIYKSSKRKGKFKRDEFTYKIYPFLIN